MMRNILIAVFAVSLLFVAACGTQIVETPMEIMGSIEQVSENPVVAPADETGMPAPEAKKSIVMSRRELATEVGTAVVEIRGFSYDPKTLVVSVGTTVTFDNEDHSEHSVTSDTFDSGVIPRDGGTWQHTFAEAGTYEIHSLDYRTVKGTIVVE